MEISNETNGSVTLASGYSFIWEFAVSQHFTTQISVIPTSSNCTLWALVRNNDFPYLGDYDNYQEASTGASISIYSFGFHGTTSYAMVQIDPYSPACSFSYSTETGVQISDVNFQNGNQFQVSFADPLTALIFVNGVSSNQPSEFVFNTTGSIASIAMLMYDDSEPLFLFYPLENHYQQYFFCVGGYDVVDTVTMKISFYSANATLSMQTNSLAAPLLTNQTISHSVRYQQFDYYIADASVEFPQYFCVDITSFDDCAKVMVGDQNELFPDIFHPGLASVYITTENTTTYRFPMQSPVGTIRIGVYGTIHSVCEYTIAVRTENFPLLYSNTSVTVNDSQPSYFYHPISNPDQLHYFTLKVEDGNGYFYWINDEIPSASTMSGTFVGTGMTVIDPQVPMGESSNFYLLVTSNNDNEDITFSLDHQLPTTISPGQSFTPTHCYNCYFWFTLGNISAEVISIGVAATPYVPITFHYNTTALPHANSAQSTGILRMSDINVPWNNLYLGVDTNSYSKDLVMFTDGLLFPFSETVTMFSQPENFFHCEIPQNISAVIFRMSTLCPTQIQNVYINWNQLPLNYSDSLEVPFDSHDLTFYFSVPSSYFESSTIYFSFTSLISCLNFIEISDSMTTLNITENSAGNSTGEIIYYYQYFEITIQNDTSLIGNYVLNITIQDPSGTLTGILSTHPNVAPSINSYDYIADPATETHLLQFILQDLKGEDILGTSYIVGVYGGEDPTLAPAPFKVFAALTKAPASHKFPVGYIVVAVIGGAIVVMVGIYVVVWAVRRKPSGYQPI